MISLFAPLFYSFSFLLIQFVLFFHVEFEGLFSPSDSELRTHLI